ncbi:MAG: hypothetical protein JO309_00190 [Pseudonocardiales bacterium]|nr:hypothetical protein [Pseudonocardiales bacterium]MBV9727841.1 hypothetical protein [Pseudonocardiales bacterium]
MSEHDRFGGPTPSGGMTESLNALIHPPAEGPAPVEDLASILLDPAQHFRLDLDQAPQAIATFRQAAHEMRDLKFEVGRLANVPAPGLDAVSINAAREIGQWAASEEPGSLRSALESGAIQLEKAADALERSLALYRNTDEVNAAHLSQPEL